MKIPSKERGCDGKINLGRSYEKQAERLAKKYGKRYGVYQCPHCLGYHVTTKLAEVCQYDQILYLTD